MLAKASERNVAVSYSAVGLSGKSASSGNNKYGAAADGKSNSKSGAQVKAEVVKAINNGVR